MPGIVGDTADKNISGMIDQMKYSYKYSQKKTGEIVCGSGNIGLGVIYRQDSSECCVLKVKSITGVIDGFAYINNSYLCEDEKYSAKIITGIFNSPGNVLPKLNGSFLIACTDGRKLIVATDKLATRPCFYAFLNKRLIISSETKSILPLLERKTINKKGIGDLLAFEFPLGDRTLVNEILSIPPATFIEWEEGKLRKKNYWKFDLGYKKSEPDYPERLLKIYEESVDNVLKTIDSSWKLGIFLSGGLDSRLLFGVLIKKNIDFLTITYDYNPPGGVNPEIGKRVSSQFGIKNIRVDFPFNLANSPDLIKESVWITEGLTPWHFFYNINFDLDHLHRYVDVVINNPRQGEFFGEDFSMNELASKLSPIEILRNNLGVFRNPVPEKIIESLLLDKYSVKKEIQQEILKNDKKSNYDVLLEVMYNNYYPNFNKINLAAKLVEIKNIFPNTKLLNAIANLPLSFRTRKIAGKIPIYPVAPLRLELIRLINMGLEKILYERTGAKPEERMYMHFLKFAKKSFSRKSKIFSSLGKSDILSYALKNKNTYSFSKLIREEKLQKYIYSIVNGLCRRDLIDNDIIYNILDKHMRGKMDYSRLIGSLTTAGIFIEKAFD